MGFDLNKIPSLPLASPVREKRPDVMAEDFRHFFQIGVYSRVIALALSADKIQSPDGVLAAGEAYVDALLSDCGVDLERQGDPTDEEAIKVGKGLMADMCEVVEITSSEAFAEAFLRSVLGLPPRVQEIRIR